MGKLIFGMLTEPEVVLFDAQVGIPVESLLDPVLEPMLIGAGPDEIFYLHLLEFAHAEDEVACGYLVPEGFTHLGDSEGKLLSSGVKHILEVDEYTLRRLGTQVGYRCLILHRAYEGLEHEVEHAGLSELAAASRTFPVFDVVGAPALLALLAVHQRVSETLHVPTGNPGLRMHKDGSIQANHIVALLHDCLPPGFLDIILEFYP
jgi:hypothetical protein